MDNSKDELGIRDIGDAYGVELPSAASLPAKNSDEIPAPEYSKSVSGAHMFVWSMDNGEQIAAKVEWPAVQNRELWAMLSVFYRKNQTQTTATPILTRTRWNLRSTTNTDGQIRVLNRRGTFQWDARLEQIKALVETAMYASAELEWFGADRPLVPVSYTLYPFLEENQHTVLAAYGGSTKSLFGLAAAISIADGVTLLPGTDVQTKGKTLYLDYEADVDTHERRYRQLLAGAEVRDITKNIAYLKLDTPILDCADSIIGMIRKHSFTNVVIDSASRAVGGDTIDESAVIAYFNMTAQFGTSILTIAHKAKDERSKGPSGSGHWFHQARSYWELLKDQTHGDNRVSVVMKHEKSNNGKLHRSLGFQIDFREDAINYSREDAATSAVNAERLPPIDRVIAFLRENSSSGTGEIAEGTGLKQAQITQLLTRKEGKLFYGSPETYNRRWSLLSKDKAEKAEPEQWWNQD
tara:strand:- start:2207 stop:3604 length:1398 start_codon:yes stop_codon:yes gene_type:complete